MLTNSHADATPDTFCDESACHVAQFAVHTLLSPVASITLASNDATKNQNARRSTRRVFQSTVATIIASNTIPMYFSGESMPSDIKRCTWSYSA